MGRMPSRMGSVLRPRFALTDAIGLPPPRRATSGPAARQLRGSSHAGPGCASFRSGDAEAIALRRRPGAQRPAAGTGIIVGCRPQTTSSAPSTPASTRLRDEARIPGVAWGVVRDGALVHAGGAGTTRDGEERLPDARSVFRIASMTKSFTASDGPAAAGRGPSRAGRSRRSPRSGACRLAPADHRQRARDHPPAADDVRRSRDRRPVGRPPAGAAAGPVRGAACRRAVIRLAAGDGLRLLQPGLRDPGPRHHERGRARSTGRSSGTASSCRWA